VSKELTRQVERLIIRGEDEHTIRAICGISKEMLEYVLENRKLKSENERLRTAGDCLVSTYVSKFSIDEPAVRAWRAAKV
jgi:regulator of replication initiation timing